MWCSFDLSGSEEPAFGPNALKSLEDCHRLGAVGVGEISDKGRGIGGRSGGRGGRGGRDGTPNAPAQPGAVINGPHADDPRMDPLWDKCAQLGMPVNIHVSDPIWSYQPMENTNDGLMNGYTWTIRPAPGLLLHDGLIEGLERAARKHPKTMFIACHLANLDYDLTRLGQMFDRNPNLYADISARFAETAPIPRFVAAFFHKYPDRVLYGTDMAYNQRMFSTTFRILESHDEHFYERDLNFNFDYHWPLNGLGLPDAILKKVYSDNARRVFQRARANAG
jgi:predicted TIM-barrel fold metal-dependent hydrolase